MSDAQPLLQQLMGKLNQQPSWELTLMAIKNDIEGLLNSFSAPIKWSQRYSQLDRSVINFGLPNYLTARYTNRSQRLHLCDSIKKQIEQNEPRLFDVDVIMENDDEDSSGLIFHIQINAKTAWQRQEREVILESDWNPLNMSFTLL